LNVWLAVAVVLATELEMCPAEDALVRPFPLAIAAPGVPSATKAARVNTARHHRGAFRFRLPDCMIETPPLSILRYRLSHDGPEQEAQKKAASVPGGPPFEQRFSLRLRRVKQWRSNTIQA
jgi:hypothetical protein